MPIASDSSIVITAFDWVPDFARGYVRDLRPRWACEEIGLDYAVRLIKVTDKPEGYEGEQPWGAVPVLSDGGIQLFESGAILLHLAMKDERLLPADAGARARALSWLFAAYSSVEPGFLELGNVLVFSRGQNWAKRRQDSLLEFLGKRLDKLQTALGDREWLAGPFSVADIAMACVLREAHGTDLVFSRPGLAAYQERALARPAYKRAYDAQMADFTGSPPKRKGA